MCVCVCVLVWLWGFVCMCESLFERWDCQYWWLPCQNQKQSLPSLFPVRQCWITRAPWQHHTLSLLRYRQQYTLLALSVCVCVCGKVKVWAWWLCWWRATLSGCVAKVVVDDYYIASWPTNSFLAVVVYCVRIYTLCLMHYRFWRTLSYADCILSLFRNFIIQSTFDPFSDAPHLWQSSCTTVTYIALPRVTCLLHELSSM